VGLGSVIGNVRSLAQAHEAYDRTLLGSALVISERLSLVDGEVVAELPYAALEMLRTDAQDRIFYRVADLRDGRYVTGYEDLPAPASPIGEEPVFYDAVYKNQDIPSRGGEVCVARRHRATPSARAGGRRRWTPDTSSVVAS
jgi:two-component system sensor histidine kinase TctE